MNQLPRIVNFNTEGETEFHWNGSNRQSSNFAFPQSDGDIHNARLQTTSPVDVDQAINDWHSIDSEEEKNNNIANAENYDQKDEWQTAVQPSATGNALGDSNPVHNADAWETAPVANTYAQGQTEQWETVQSENQQNGAWDNEQPEVYEAGQGDVYSTEEYDTAAASTGNWETPAPAVAHNDEAWGTVTENDDDGNGIGEGFETVNTDDDGSIAWGSQENFDVDWGTAHEIASPENQVKRSCKLLTWKSIDLYLVFR